MKRVAQEDLIRALARLSRLAREPLDAERRADLAEARDLLRRVVGPTVRPAQVARLLGLSQPALRRWVVKGDVPTVLTPAGRQEVPLEAVIDLLEDVEQAGDDPRPLATVMANRRQSAERVDLNRLVPPRRERGHRAAELHALAYHRLVAERLDDQLLAEARRRVERWRKEDRVDPRWTTEWERVLSLPIERIKGAIGADTRQGRELRQTSPFAGALTEQERSQLVRQVEERFGS